MQYAWSWSWLSHKWSEGKPYLISKTGLDSRARPVYSQCSVWWPVAYTGTAIGTATAPARCHSDTQSQINYGQLQLMRQAFLSALKSDWCIIDFTMTNRYSYQNWTTTYNHKLSSFELTFSWILSCSADNVHNSLLFTILIARSFIQGQSLKHGLILYKCRQSLQGINNYKTLY